MARKRKQEEFPIEGKGVSPLHLAEVDALAEDYVTERDKRLVQTPKEVAAKRKLIEALHAHADALRQPTGELIYRYDDMQITLTPGQEKLRVESVQTEVVDPD